MLNVNFKNCKAAFEICPQGYKPSGLFDMVKRNADGQVTHRLSMVTRGIIPMMMSIGIGNISEKTIDEFILRSELLQDVAGPMGPGHDNGKNIIYSRITPDDIKNHMGLSCNVSKKTWTVFLEKLKNVVKDRLAKAA